MNIAELSKLTPDEKRVKIAEACGWILGSPITGEGAFHWRTEKKYMPGYCDQRPNYLSDLNAMHEAEKTLTDQQWIAYVDRLNEIVLPPAWRTLMENTQKRAACAHAKATERANAFLSIL